MVQVAAVREQLYRIWCVSLRTVVSTKHRIAELVHHLFIVHLSVSDATLKPSRCKIGVRRHPPPPPEEISIRHPSPTVVTVVPSHSWACTKMLRTMAAGATLKPWFHVTRISCRWQTCATRCITANVLQTNMVDAQCDKLAAELSLTTLRVESRNFQPPHPHLTYPPAFGTAVWGEPVWVLPIFSATEN